MKIAIAGKNDIAVNCLKFLIEEQKINKKDVYVVPTEKDCGIDTWQKSLTKIALEKKIKIIDLKSLYNIKNLIFISLQYDKIIKPSLFQTNKIFNIHFSLLPKYKGLYTSIYPLLLGDCESGVTLHQIDDGIDTGDILSQNKFHISLDDNARSLYFKYLSFGYNLFVREFQNLLEDKINKIRQNYSNSSYYGKNSIDFKNIKINLDATSFQIHNQLRAFIFPEYQLPRIGKIPISKSILTDYRINKNCFEDHKEHFILSGIDGYKIIAIKNVENPAKVKCEVWDLSDESGNQIYP